MNTQKKHSSTGENQFNFRQYHPKKNISIPNILSLLRILMIPPAVWLFIGQHYQSAALVVVLSFISDIADGYIARNFNQVTQLGKILDPIADKLTQMALSIALCFTYQRMIPLMIVLLVKELLMMTLGLAMMKQGLEPMSACWWGKLSTGAFYIGIVIIMVFHKILPPFAISFISIGIAILLIFSLIRYIMMYIDNTPPKENA